MKICFSSDLHGSINQYKKLFLAAKKERADAVILGGDLLPKDALNRTIKKQREFLEKKLRPLIKKESKNYKIYLMLGNDDFKDNLKHLVKLSKRDNSFEVLSLSPKKLNGWNILGYPYIPLTPFKYKDWEKLDSNGIRETEYRKDIVLKGVVSKNKKLIHKKISLFPRNDTIENDFKKIKPSKKMIWVVHSPPFNSYLDMVDKKTHVGSIAVRNAILKLKPFISLHGHVHESPDISGRFKEKIGETWCYSSGNYPAGKILHYIVVDFNKPKKGERKTL